MKTPQLNYLMKTTYLIKILAEAFRNYVHRQCNKHTSERKNSNTHSQYYKLNY